MSDRIAVDVLGLLMKIVVVTYTSIHLKLYEAPGVQVFPIAVPHAGASCASPACVDA